MAVSLGVYRICTKERAALVREQHLARFAVLSVGVLSPVIERDLTRRFWHR